MWPVLLTFSMRGTAPSAPLVTVEASPRPTSYPVPAPPVHAPQPRPVGLPPKAIARQMRLRTRNLLLVAKGGLEPMDDAAFAAALRAGQADIRARRG